MQFYRFNPEEALPLENGTRATYIPIRHDGRMVAMQIQLDRRGDTGKREFNLDLMLSVVEGEGFVRSGGSVAEIRAGDVCILPDGLLHNIWTTDSMMRVVITLMGSGEMP
nr:hypothetical protein [Anaerolineae bacterium]